MHQDARNKELLAGRGFWSDGWVWVALGVTVASLTGLVLSDLLPPALEERVVDTMLYLYGAMMLGGFVWTAIATVRWLHRAGWQYSLWSLFIALFVVAAFLGVALAVGARLAGLLLAAALQLLTPVAVVRFGARSRSSWSGFSLIPSWSTIWV